VYTTPATDIAVKEWVRQENISHTALTVHHRALPDAERFDAFVKCYQAAPGVSTCVVAYKVLVPIVDNRLFANLIAYVIAQEANIKETLTRVAVGYGSEAAHLASNQSSSTAQASMAQTMFTQAQLDAAISAALARHDRTTTTGPLKYCWFHGHQYSHKSADCKSCKNGAPLFANAHRDEPDRATRCFSHANCQHAPPCISAADAKRATKPDSFPATPGNNARPR
jgi:hypothetical protein